MYRTTMWCVATGMLIFLALSLSSPMKVAASKEQTFTSVEYKVVPASEFGMKVQNGEGLFDHRDMAENLNKFAADGWQYRDFIAAADSTVLSVVLLERRR